MLKRKTTAMFLIVFTVLALGSLAPLPAQSEDDDTDASVSGKVDDEGLALEFEVGADDEEQAAAPQSSDAGGAWYDNPVMIAVIGVGALVLLVLVVMAVRGGTAGGRVAGSAGH